MSSHSHATGWGLIRLPHARKLDAEIDEELRKVREECDMSEEPNEVHTAARAVALNWRDACRYGNDQVIDDRLHRSLDHLVAVFERHAARRLGELYAHRAMKYFINSQEDD